MKKIKVILFNLDPQNGSGEKLAQLLETSGTNSFELKHEIVSESDMPEMASHFSSALSDFSPDIGFFLFGSSSRPVVTELFKVFRTSRPAQPIIAVVNSGDPKHVTEALYHGANDFLIPPFRVMDLLPRLWRWVEERREELVSVRQLKEELGLTQLIGESDAFLAEIKKLPAFARCDSNILITGETGTGKEICARAIHFLSSRASQPFIALNCGAIPAELVENELFGHEPGAFTSAASSALGLVQEAEGGTLFLDEIDALPLQAQVKLLRLVQEKEFRQLGARKTRKADLRFIAACNTSLEESVKGGRFRQDLYYRINVITLHLPPLRQRRGDVSLLARYFVAKFTIQSGRASKTITPEAMQKLVLHEWPGNVRELENIIERSVVLSEHTNITQEEIVLQQPAVATSGTDSFKALKAIAIADFERKYIDQLLEGSQGNIAAAARTAKKNRRAFWQLMRKHHIRAENHRSP